jgi:predicted RNase H-like nuclease (RuvC/YqgF family)
MSDLELTMMRRVGELKAEVERLKKFNDEALAHIAKEERKSRERLDMEQAENARLKEAIADSYKAVDEMEKRFKELEAEFEMHPMAVENASLKAYVERLTKAGDELGEWFMDIHPSKKKWNAAKEGKHS